MNRLFNITKIIITAFYLTVHKETSCDLRDTNEYMNDVIYSEEFKKFEQETIIPQAKKLNQAIAIWFLSCVLLGYLFGFIG